MVIRIVLVLFFLLMLAFVGVDIYRQEYFYLMFDALLAVMIGVLYKLLGDFEKNKKMFR